MSCGVGGRIGLNPALLWLWRRLAATAPIRPLAWERPYAMGVAQEIAKRQKKKKKKGKIKTKQNKTKTFTTWEFPSWSRGNNPIRNPEVAGSIPGLTQRAKDPVLP